MTVLKNCSSTQKLLSSYIDGCLSSCQRRTVESHISNCKACAKELEALKSLSQLLASTHLDSQPRLSELDELLFAEKLQSKLDEVFLSKSNPVRWAATECRCLRDKVAISSAYEAFAQNPTLYLSRILKQAVFITAIVSLAVFVDRNYIRPAPIKVEYDSNQTFSSLGHLPPHDAFGQTLRPVGISYKPRSLAQSIRLIYAYAEGPKPLKNFDKLEKEPSKLHPKMPFNDAHNASAGEEEMFQSLQNTQMKRPDETPLKADILHTQDDLPSLSYKTIIEEKTKNKSGLSSIISSNVDLPLPSLRELAKEKVN